MNQWKIAFFKVENENEESSQTFFDDVKILSPEEDATHANFVMGGFNTKEEAENCLAYMNTRFVRYLINAVIFMKTGSRHPLSLVPIQDFTKRWTDEELYKKYRFSAEEIASIENCNI